MNWMRNTLLICFIVAAFDFQKGVSTSLTYWGRVAHICITKLTISDSDNGLAPGLGQAIIWANAEISLIRSLGTKFSDILIKIYMFSFKKMHLEMLSGKCLPFCLSLNSLWESHHITWSVNLLRFYSMEEYAYHLTIEKCTKQMNLLPWAVYLNRDGF